MDPISTQSSHQRISPTTQATARISLTHNAGYAGNSDTSSSSQDSMGLSEQAELLAMRKDPSSSSGITNSSSSNSMHYSQADDIEVASSLDTTQMDLTQMEIHPLNIKQEPLIQDGMVNSTQRRGRQIKRGTKDKICLVCGDRALGYNFNAVTCESCKAFFRRNAFRQIWGRCTGECEINQESRSYCKKCRLKKCFTIGMKRDLILNERQKEERRLKIHENRVTRIMGGDGMQISPEMSPHPLDETSNHSSMDGFLKSAATATATSPAESLPGLPPGPIPSITLPPGMALPTGPGLAVPPEILDRIKSSGTDLSALAGMAGLGKGSGMDLSALAGMAGLGKGSGMDLSALAGMAKGSGMDLSALAGMAKGSGMDLSALAGLGKSSGMDISALAGMAGLGAATNLGASTSAGAGGGGDAATATAAAASDSKIPPEILKKMSSLPPSAMAKMASMMKGGGLAEMRQMMGGFGTLMGLSSSEGMSQNSHVLAGDIEPLRYAAMVEPNKKLLVEIINAFQKTFDAPITRDVVDRPNNADFLNMADASVRRLIKCVKSLQTFRDLNSDDQVILLKGCVLEVLVLRSVKLFDPKTMNWNLPGNRGITSERMRETHAESMTFMKLYQSFASNVMSAIRRDNVILMMLMILTVFSPDRPGLKAKEQVESIQQTYAEVLQEFIVLNHPRDRVMFARVLQKLADIRNLQEVHANMLQNVKMTELEPLMVEIFDLSSV